MSDKTVMIVAKDYEAARFAAAELGLGSGWLYLHEGQNLADLWIDELVIVRGWSGSGITIELLAEARARLKRDGLVTSGNARPGGIVTSSVEQRPTADSYTPRHMERSKFGSGAATALGALIGFALVVAAAFAIGWLPW